MSQHLKILNIVGARPNLPKIAPLIREMQRHAEIEAILVHTGQHYDEKLSDIFFCQMGIPSPHVNLEVGSGSHASQTAEILKRIEPVLVERKPDLVLVVGDVNSTIAVSLAAAKLGIHVAHVEAGLRSFDRTMPEEINRILTDALADYLFVTEEDAIEHLLKEGRPRSSIFMVGNVMIDSLLHFLPTAQHSRIGDDLGLKNGAGWRHFGVLTLHRPSNVDSTEKLSQLLGAIDAVAAEMPVIFPVHPRTQQRLTQSGIQHHSQLRLIPPVGYLDFLCLLSKQSLSSPILVASRKRPRLSVSPALRYARTRSAPLPSPKAQTCWLVPIRAKLSRLLVIQWQERVKQVAFLPSGTAILQSA